MTFSRPHERNDWIALQLARLAARRIRENPNLIQLGLERIRHFRALGRDFSAHREWETIINTHTAEEIAAILEAETEEGQRLRSSKPFVGPPFVNDPERLQIIAEAFAE
jgi:hypothetical protein